MSSPATPACNRLESHLVELRSLPKGAKILRHPCLALGDVCAEGKTCMLQFFPRLFCVPYLRRLFDGATSAIDCGDADCRFAHTVADAIQKAKLSGAQCSPTATDSAKLPRQIKNATTLNAQVGWSSVPASVAGNRGLNITPAVVIVAAAAPLRRSSPLSVIEGLEESLAAHSELVFERHPCKLQQVCFAEMHGNKCRYAPFPSTFCLLYLKKLFEPKREGYDPNAKRCDKEKCQYLHTIHTAVEKQLQRSIEGSGAQRVVGGSAADHLKIQAHEMALQHSFKKHPCRFQTPSDFCPVVGSTCRYAEFPESFCLGLLKILYERHHQHGYDPNATRCTNRQCTLKHDLVKAIESSRSRSAPACPPRPLVLVRETIDPTLQLEVKGNRTTTFADMLLRDRNPNDVTADCSTHVPSPPAKTTLKYSKPQDQPDAFFEDQMLQGLAAGGYAAVASMLRPYVKRDCCPKDFDSDAAEAGVLPRIEVHQQIPHKDQDLHLMALILNSRENFVAPMRRAFGLIRCEWARLEQLSAYNPGQAEAYFSWDSVRNADQSHDVRYYRGVTFCGGRFTEAGLVFSLHIDLACYDRRTRWERRLLIGSVLFLSFDCFKSAENVFRATVVKTYTEENSQNKRIFTGDVDVQVIMETNKLLKDLLCNCDEQRVWVVESKIFFLPYQQVHQLLEEIVSDSSCGPFLGGLLLGAPSQQQQADAAQQMIPAFLQQANLLLSDAVAPAQDGDRIYFKPQAQFPRRDFMSWSADVEQRMRMRYTSSGSHVHVLDDTQLSAIKHILTSRVALVQGPPGTGKTFIGEKYLQILWENWSTLASAVNAPIIVACETNHAIDSVLHGVMAFMKPQDFSRYVVRLGSTKDEQLSSIAFHKLWRWSQSSGGSSHTVLQTSQDAMNCLDAVEEALADALRVVRECSTVASTRLRQLAAGNDEAMRFSSSVLLAALHRSLEVLENPTPFAPKTQIDILTSAQMALQSCLSDVSELQAIEVTYAAQIVELHRRLELQCSTMDAELSDIQSCVSQALRLRGSDTASRSAPKSGGTELEQTASNVRKLLDSAAHLESEYPPFAAQGFKIVTDCHYQSIEFCKVVGRKEKNAAVPPLPPVLDDIQRQIFPANVFTAIFREGSAHMEVLHNLAQSIVTQVQEESLHPGNPSEDFLVANEWLESVTKLQHRLRHWWSRCESLLFAVQNKAKLSQHLDQTLAKKSKLCHNELAETKMLASLADRESLRFASVCLFLNQSASRVLPATAAAAPCAPVDAAAPDDADVAEEEAARLMIENRDRDAGDFDHDALRPARKATQNNENSPPALSATVANILQRLELVSEKVSNINKSLLDLYCDVCNSKTSHENVAKAHFLKKKFLVAGTITGVTRLARMLKSLQPKIVMIEEAAEVREEAIWACLASRSVEQLILIGDHMQLQPKIDEEVLRRNNYGVSMMERLVSAGHLPHVTITMQRRMHPEISALVKPYYLRNGTNITIQDHQSTLDRPMQLFLSHLPRVSHIDPQGNETRDPSSQSYTNTDEALYVVRIAIEVVERWSGQGEPSLTILTMYRGQQLLVQRMLWDAQRSRRSTFHTTKIRVSTVDDYQGEESDLILLSTVRTPRSSRDNIGFLHKENRWCVALSRARSQLIVVGSTTLLTCAPAKHILRDLHDHLVASVNAKKFSMNVQKIPVHSCADVSHQPVMWFVHSSTAPPQCTSVCRKKLQRCGHECAHRCSEHRSGSLECPSQCKETCSKPQPGCGHPCKQHCGHASSCSATLCRTSVKMVCSKCGFADTISCHQSVSWKCRAPCQNLLPCGHQCPSKCGVTHEHHDIACHVVVDKQVDACGHTVQISCCRKPSRKDCDHVCGQVLPDCGHVCQATCKTCEASASLHSPCVFKASVPLPCGHSAATVCSEPFPACVVCSDASPQQPLRNRKQVPTKRTAIALFSLDGVRWCPKLLPCGHRCCGVDEGDVCPSYCVRCDGDLRVYGSDEATPSRFENFEMICRPGDETSALAKAIDDIASQTEHGVDANDRRIDPFLNAYAALLVEAPCCHKLCFAAELITYLQQYFDCESLTPIKCFSAACGASVTDTSQYPFTSRYKTYLQGLCAQAGAAYRVARESRGKYAQQLNSMVENACRAVVGVRNAAQFVPKPIKSPSVRRVRLVDALLAEAANSVPLFYTHPRIRCLLVAAVDVIGLCWSLGVDCPPPHDGAAVGSRLVAVLEHVVDVFSRLQAALTQPGHEVSFDLWDVCLEFVSDIIACDGDGSRDRDLFSRITYARTVSAKQLRRTEQDFDAALAALIDVENSWKLVALSVVSTLSVVEVQYKLLPSMDMTRQPPHVVPKLVSVDIDVEHLRQRCEEIVTKDPFVVGRGRPVFVLNPCLLTNCSCVQRFAAGVGALAQSSSAQREHLPSDVLAAHVRRLLQSEQETRVVFHGTSGAALSAICCRGFDVTRRAGQAHGPGEYFGLGMVLSDRYIKEGASGQLMVCVAVRVGPSIVTRPDKSMMIVNNTTDAALVLPVGIVEYANGITNGIRSQRLFLCDYPRVGVGMANTFLTELFRRMKSELTAIAAAPSSPTAYASPIYRLLHVPQEMSLSEKRAAWDQYYAMLERALSTTWEHGMDVFSYPAKKAILSNLSLSLPHRSTPSVSAASRCSWRVVFGSITMVPKNCYSWKWARDGDDIVVYPQVVDEVNDVMTW